MRITICLLLGVVTTVAVAWGCVAFFPTGPDDVQVSRALWRPRGDRLGYRTLVMTTTGRQRFMTLGFPGRSVVTNRRPPAELVPWWIDHPEEQQLEVAAGWPELAVRSSARGAWRGGPWPSEHEAFVFGLEESVDFGRNLSLLWTEDPARLFPIRPIARGFLINTLFFAAIWFGIWGRDS